MIESARRPRPAQRSPESRRLRRLPVYVFAELDRLKAEARRRGADLIDLGMGNPDAPVHPTIVEAMRRALAAPANHRYPDFRGAPAFREAAARWCARQYGAALDPETEVVPLIGSKEGLVHLALATLSPGDVTLLPQPAYPAHFRGTLLADATPYAIPQRPAAELYEGGDGLLPDLRAIPARVLKRARLLLLSYPTNPTAACAPRALLEDALAFARRHRLLLVHDFAYSEIYFDGVKPPSLLALAGAKEIAVEVHSFSKTFSMAGWRIGFATGNARLLATLMKLKSNCDYGVFQAAQEAGVAALGLGERDLAATREIYRRRRDLFVEGLKRLGWKIETPRATMYVWVPAPRRSDGARFAAALLSKAGVVVAPGSAFGAGGARHVRFALVEPEARLREALARMERAGLRP